MLIGKELPNFNFTDCRSCFSLQCMVSFDIKDKHPENYKKTFF